MAASETNSMHFGVDSRPGSFAFATGIFLVVAGILLVVPTILLIAGSDYGIAIVGFGPLGLYFLVMTLLFGKKVHSVDLRISPREAHVLVEGAMARRKKMRHFRIPDDARVVLKEDNDGRVEVTIDGLPGYVDFAHLKRDSAGTAAPVAPLGLDDEDVEALKEIAGDKQWTAFQLTREIAAFLGLKPDGEVRMAVPRKS
jgi:hypothetical protein